MNSLVLDNPNEFVEHINYAHEIINSPDKRKYSLNLSSESNLKAHESKMNYLRQYVSVPAIKELIGGVEKRVNEFKESINGPDI